MKVNRRSVLRGVMVSAAGMFWTACSRIPGVNAVPTLASVQEIQAQATREASRVPDPTTVVESAPTEAVKSPPWPSVERGPGNIWVTSPLERFYETRYNYAVPRPELNRDEWTLRVSGLVGKSLTLTYADLAGLTSVDQMRTLQCISNPVGGTLIGNTLWTGIRFSDLLQRAEVKSSAREVKMSAADGYVTSIPLEMALDPDALLVYQMDGRPLTVKHGFPVRVLLPGRYGQKQPKWITGIELISEHVLGYWEERGWSNLAPVRVNSQFWDPQPYTTVRGPEVVLSGIAYADESGVSQVQVRVNSGAWQDAELLSGPTSLVWTEWRYRWQVPSVTRLTAVTLSVRATDGSGNVQRPAPEGQGPLNGTFPDGTSDIHQIVVNLEP